MHAQLHTLAHRLPAGPLGAYARHLLRVAPDLPVPAFGDAFAVWGKPARRFEVSIGWTFGTEGLDELEAYLREQEVPAYFADGRGEVTDLFWAHRAAWERDPGVVWFDRRPEVPVAASIAARFPPDPLWASIGFRYVGVVHDGEIAATCDVTIDDGAYVGIQGVFTDPQRRGMGLGSRVVRAAVADVHERGRTPLYLCDRDNAGSVAVARGAGFTVEGQLGLVDEANQAL